MFRSLSLILIVFCAQSAFSAEESYTEKLKRELQEKDAKSDTSRLEKNYTENLRRKLDEEAKEESPDEESDSKNFTESAQKKLKADEEDAEKHDSKNYSQKLRDELKPKEMTGAIQALKEGKSQLELHRSLDINMAGGFRLGASVNKTFTAKGQTGAAFSSVYGSPEDWHPDVTLFFDYLPLYDDGLGAIGLGAQVGISYYAGKGVFRFPLSRPDGTSFGTSAKNNFYLTIVPMGIGPVVRLNLLNYVRPYGRFVPVFIFYRESRDDSDTVNKGMSKAFQYVAGVNILLDWMSRSASFSAYDVLGVKHLYLTAEYLTTSTYDGSLEMSDEGIYGGLTFEF